MGGSAVEHTVKQYSQYCFYCCFNLAVEHRLHSPHNKSVLVYWLIHTHRFSLWFFLPLQLVW